jgi:hypothetical protein
MLWPNLIYPIMLLVLILLQFRVLSSFAESAFYPNQLWNVIYGPDLKLIKYRILIASNEIIELYMHVECDV